MEIKVNDKVYTIPPRWNTDDGRYWEYVVYPDSAPSDWMYQIEMTGLKVAISPLHDKDVIEGTDEPKKPHWHVLCIWKNKTTFKHAISLCDMFNSPVPMRKEDVQGAFDYHTHKNHANKAQYDDRDRKLLNGLVKSDITKLTEDDIRIMTAEIIAIIRSEEIYEYGHLVDYLLDHQLHEFFSWVTSHTIMFDKYVTSRRHANYKKKMRKDNNLPSNE